MFTYEFPLMIDLGKSIADVGRIVDSVNAALPMFGVSEHVAITSEVAHFTVTAGRPLTEEETEIVRQQLECGARERLPELGVRVGNARRQSRQSGYQSAASE
jgi:hypothetical protein